MCGILFTNDPTIDKTAFLKALDLLRHRGPDAPGGYHARDHFKLGHHRLKIIDLDDRSNQPFRSADGRYVMVYNGEIYNYQELAKAHGILTRTSSDTEVLLELFVRFGPRMLPMLNGMFALIILDTQNNELFAARDRLGIKPLYFSRNGSKAILSSEISPLLELTEKSQIDTMGLRQYLKLRTFFNGRTLYKGIEMFPAGHYLLNGKFERYWELPVEPQKQPEDDELREVIVSAVNYRCLSDVPVGSYLSGGLDSTIVAYLAGKPHTWTVGFANHNEFPWARLASERHKTIHTEVLIDPDEFVDIARQLIRRRREPLSVPNEVLLYKMTREVKKKNTVILSGEGADELFFGYDRIFRWAEANDWDLAEFSQRYAYGSHDDLQIVADAVSPYFHYGRPIDIVAAFFQTAHLHGLLRRLDFTTMQSGVEARVPFVDHRLIEVMAGVPFEYRIENQSPKAPLKRIFRKDLPPEIILRKKIGFPVPLESLPLPKQPGESPMDAWLRFNLDTLGIDIEDIRRDSRLSSDNL
jgi:asparagine synthase (glutamine-hydrolysing)